ncbi:MAG: hypothetical protein NWE90_07395 [Candidatus Bathyarchaeota archaeon]|nr:hypothetical protein [Candidatus Bathyarchaeota archaeon]
MKTVNETEPKTTQPDDNRKFEFDGTSTIWLNRTKSGKGVKIVTPDDRMFISSVDNLRRLVDQEYDGVKFTELVEVV